MTRPKPLPRQLVVRVSEDMHARLVADAEANGRTVAQSVRFHLGAVLRPKTVKYDTTIRFDTERSTW